MNNALNQKSENEYYDDLLRRHSNLVSVGKDILDAYSVLAESFERGGKLLICGNGGSAADSEHIVGELMKSFLIPDNPPESFQDALIDVDQQMGVELSGALQHALPAIALTGLPALSTAFANDCNPNMSFAQQVYGLGVPLDSFLGISTSGNSKNVVYAAIVAKAKKMNVITLTGAHDSLLSKLSDVCIQVPETETFKVQELHLPVYHCLCAMLEHRFFAKAQ